LIAEIEGKYSSKADGPHLPSYEEFKEKSKTKKD
jgi:hypothetical protein